MCRAGGENFEITYRRGRAVYRIKVENPLGVSRGVVAVEVDGPQTDGAIELMDDITMCEWLWVNKDLKNLNLRQIRG